MASTLHRDLHPFTILGSGLASFKDFEYRSDRMALRKTFRVPLARGAAERWTCGRTLDRAFTRVSGAPLLGGNAVRLLEDAAKEHREH